MPKDLGHEWTDARIEEIAGRIAEVYAAALEEMQRKEFGELKNYERSRKAWERRVKSGRATEEKFAEWRMQRGIEMTRNQGIVDQLARRANAANEAAAEMVAGDIPTVFSYNANWEAFRIDQQLGKMVGLDIINEDAVRRLMIEDPDLLPTVGVDAVKDVAWNRQKFSSAVTQSILMGESVDQLTERIVGVMGTDESHARMQARTAFTSAENGGRTYTHERARSNGVVMDDVWHATLDGRTRDSHRLMHGEVKEAGMEYFSNGLRFPGDPNGEPEEVCNCRCRLDGLVHGFERDYSDMSAQWSDLPEGATFDRWVAGEYSGYEGRRRSG